LNYLFSERRLTLIQNGSDGGARLILVSSLRWTKMEIGSSGIMAKPGWTNKLPINRVPRARG
jgi:hypothetical protein